MTGKRNTVANAKRTTIKKRNLIAMDMHTNGLYRPKVERDPKAYRRHEKHKHNGAINEQEIY